MADDSTNTVDSSVTTTATPVIAAPSAPVTPDPTAEADASVPSPAPDAVVEVAPVQPDPIPELDNTTAPVTPSEPPLLAPQPTAAPKTPDDLALYAHAEDFVLWLEQEVQNFLDIMDIPNVNDRRNAVIDLELGEDGLDKKIQVADSVLKLQIAYAAEAGSQELMIAADTYIGKLFRMREFLGV